jgi:hypothetical protein
MAAAAGERPRCGRSRAPDRGAPRPCEQPPPLRQPACAASSLTPRRRTPPARPSVRRPRSWSATWPVGKITLGSDKAYDVHVAKLRNRDVTPHIAQNTARRSAIDRYTTRHPGNGLSQRARKPLRRRSAGSRPRAACARPATAGSTGSAGHSPSRWPPTISQTARRHDLIAGASKHPLTGRRITEMELWDTDFLDLVQPA